jgi:RHS repeat-associated protein
LGWWCNGHGRVDIKYRKVTVIAGKSYTTGYTYSQTGKLASMTYPSGRVITTSFTATRMVTQVTTKQTATAAVVNVATGITYQPLSDLLNSITHGNGLVTTAGYDLDQRLTSLNVKNGATVVQGSTYAYGDVMNLTGVTDTVTAANSNALSYTPANRLASASGAWGLAAYSYDPVGNRLSDVVTGPSNLNRQASIDSFSNRLMSMTENGAAFRSYTYDGAGNIITDVRPGETYGYTYNKRNRLASVTRNTVAYATYGYNALEQLTTRTTSAAGGPVGTIAYVYDLDGHLIVEANSSTGATLREYIWLPANDNRMTTAGGRMGETLGLASLAANDNNPVDLPLAIVDTVNTTPTLLMVHTDHLGRPTRLTDATKATVWQATYKPWGEVQSMSGTRTNNLRFPGQYFQIETNLAYNWHRHYDPVTGRYTQPDPLGFVDGPSVYAYAGNSPFMVTDRDGRCAQCVGAGLGALGGAAYVYWNSGGCASWDELFEGAFNGALIGSGLSSLRFVSLARILGRGAFRRFLQDQSGGRPGNRGNYDHKADVNGGGNDLANSLAKPGESVVSEGSVLGRGVNRRADNQVIGTDGRTRVVVESERRPNGSYHKNRVNEPEAAGIEVITRPPSVWTK